MFFYELNKELNMPKQHFPQQLDYEALKAQYGDTEPTSTTVPNCQVQTAVTPNTDDEDADTSTAVTGLTGSRLRSYAFAVLTRREYSKKELIEKLCLYAQSREEVLTLVEEFAAANYQSDQRVAEMTLRSQMQRGKGPQRIKQSLKSKALDQAYIQDELEQIDWLAQAYQLKVKKYGTEVATDPKIKAKQARFLLYRGFQMDVVMKAIRQKANDWDD